MAEINGIFRNFVSFAEAQIELGNKKAVARDTGIRDNILGGHVIKSATPDSATFDKVGNVFSRTNAAKEANAHVRELLYNSIVQIYGDESRIPLAVKKQMTNFGTTKPLTARRIIAISNAMQAEVEKTRQKLVDSGVISPEKARTLNNQDVRSLDIICQMTDPKNYGKTFKCQFTRSYRAEVEHLIENTLNEMCNAKSVDKCFDIYARDSARGYSLSINGTQCIQAGNDENVNDDVVQRLKNNVIGIVGNERLASVYVVMASQILFAPFASLALDSDLGKTNHINREPTPPMAGNNKTNVEITDGEDGWKNVKMTFAFTNEHSSGCPTGVFSKNGSVNYMLPVDKAVVRNIEVNMQVKVSQKSIRVAFDSGTCESMLPTGTKILS